MPFTVQLACKMDQKSSERSIENRSGGALKIDQTSVPGPSRDASWRPWKGVSKGPRERFGASPARPRSAWRIPKRDPGRQKERLGASGSAPRRPKLTPSRVRERKIRVVFARFALRPIFDRFSLDLRSIFGCSRKSFGERARSKFRAIFGSGTRSLTLTKHRPQQCFVRVGHFEASRLARSRKPRNITKIDSEIEPRSARAVSNKKPRKSTLKWT